jgi:hypothetical protein
MEILPPQFASESPAPPAQPADELGMVALRVAAPAVCRPFEPSELVEAFDCTAGLRFPIETFIA